MSETKARICKFSAAPEYLQDNPHIRTGYRVDYSYLECAKSYFHLKHNEAGNMWSHMLGFLIFLALDFYVVTTLPPAGASAWDVSVLLIYLLGCKFCMLASSIFHACSAHSEKTYGTCLTLDLSGISCLILTSYIPPLHFAFKCVPFYQKLYLRLIVIFALVGLIGPLFDFFHLPKMRYVRIGFYTSMTVFGLVPMTHACFLYSWANFLLQFHYIFIMFGCYGTGLLFYITRMPECFSAGKFDLLGHSHQIWHIFVFLGALAQFYAGLSMFYSSASATCLTPGINLL